jgi:DNA-binding HxlR family transcriptional regulator
MKTTHADDPYFPAQPMADFSASRWSLSVAHRLVTAATPMRFRELMRDLPGISGQELTRLLRRFEEQKLVIREDAFEAGRRITYRPSMALLEASPALRALASWARLLADQLSASRSAERI